jgi:hypothetical protein
MVERWRGLDMIDKVTMSLFELAYLGVTVSGFIAISIQLWLQRYQARLLYRSIDAQTNASVAQRQLEVDKLFVERSYLGEYFLQQKIPDAGHLLEASSMAMLLLNYFDTYFLQKDQKAKQMYPEDAWEAYIAFHFKNSRFLCDFLHERRALFSHYLVNLMEGAADRR